MKSVIKIFMFIVVILSSAYSVYAETSLLWDASSGVVTGYRIYYGIASGVYQGMEEVGNVTQYPLSTLPLQEKTTYYLVVKGYNAAGESNPSNEITWFCPDSSPPIPPQNLTRQVSGSNVVLNWNANSEADLIGYKVYQGTSHGIYGAPTSLGKVTTYTISGLTQVHTYYIAITAEDNASNESGYSTEVSATIPDTTVPVVAITSPTAGSTYATTISSISLSGTASDNAVLTSVAWSNSSGQGGTATGTTSWSIPGIALTEGTNTLTVTASDSAGNSASKTLTVTYTIPDTIAPVVAITAPTSNSSYATSVSSITLSGTSSDNKAVTQVTWSSSSGSSGTATGTTSWSVSGISLSSGTNTLTITARDSAGNSASKTMTVTYSVPKSMPDVTVPTIRILSPTSSSSYSTKSSSVKLAGRASDNVKVTKVIWANSATGTSGTATGTTNWTTATMTLKIGTNIITLTASDAAGNKAKDTLTIMRLQ